MEHLYVEPARTILQIPGPRIVEWSATTHNSVGSEYIIMEEATGTQLSNIWDEISPETKFEIMSEVVSIETKLLSISFSQYRLTSYRFKTLLTHS